MSDRSLTEPEWPKGYPCIATQDWVPNVGLDNMISIDRDDEGMVMQESKEKQLYYVQLPADKFRGRAKGIAGWVDWNAVEVGRTRKVSEGWVIDAQRPADPSLPAKTYFDTGNLLNRTITALASSYCESRDEMPASPTYLHTCFSTKVKIKEFTALVSSGVANANQKLADLFATGKFTVRQILEVAPIVSQDNRKGIYMLICSDFKDGSGSERFDIYVGSTTRGFRKRYCDHLQAVEDEENRFHDSRLYKHIRTSGKWNMYGLCIFGDLTQVDEPVKLCEQVFVDLFQSYTVSLLRFEPSYFVDERFGTTLDQSTDFDKAQRYVLHKDQAWFLTHQAAAVFEVGNVINYRRTDYRVFADTKNEGRIVFSKWGYKAHPNHTDGKKEIKYQWHLQKGEDGPTASTSVNVVFEIRVDDEDHQLASARLPIIGAFDDWQATNQIGLRIEWDESDGSQWYRYQQVGRPGTTMAGTPRGAVQGYNIASAIKAYLLQEKRDFDRDARDDLSGLWNFVVTPPFRISQEKWVVALKELGAAKVATADDPLPPKESVRKSCDACMLDSSKNYVAGPVKYQCLHCSTFDRPCTWTPNDNLMSNEGLKAALHRPDVDAGGKRPRQGLKLIVNQHKPDPEDE